MSLLATDDVLSRFVLAPGFSCSATACGLKQSGALDLALVWSDRPCSAAGMFTTNRVQAAPVTLDRETLATSAARIRGVFANAGCANAVTGERGPADRERWLAGDEVGKTWHLCDRCSRHRSLGGAAEAPHRQRPTRPRR